MRRWGRCTAGPSSWAGQAVTPPCRLVLGRRTSRAAGQIFFEVRTTPSAHRGPTMHWQAVACHAGATSRSLGSTQSGKEEGPAMQRASPAPLGGPGHGGAARQRPPRPCRRGPSACHSCQRPVGCAPGPGAPHGALGAPWPWLQATATDMACRDIAGLPGRLTGGGPSDGAAGVGQAAAGGTVGAPGLALSPGRRAIGRGGGG